MSKILNTILQVKDKFYSIASTNADTLSALMDGEVGGPYTMVIDEDTYFMFDIVEMRDPTTTEDNRHPCIRFIRTDGSYVEGVINLDDWDFSIPPELLAQIDTCADKTEDAMYKAIKASEDAMAVYAYTAGVASQLSVSTTVDSSVLENEYNMAVASTAQGHTETLDEVHQTVVASADPSTGKVTQLAFLSVVKSVWGKLKALLPENSLKLPDSGVFYLDVIADLVAVVLKAVFEVVLALVEAVLLLVCAALYLVLEVLKGLVSIFTATVTSDDYVLDPDPDEANLLVNAPLLSVYQDAVETSAAYTLNTLYDVNGLYNCYCVENVSETGDNRTVSSVSYLCLSFKGEDWLNYIRDNLDNRELYFDGYSWTYKPASGSSVRSKGLYLPNSFIANPRNPAFHSTLEEEVVLPIYDSRMLKARYVSNLIAFVYDSTTAVIPQMENGVFGGMVIPYQIFSDTADIDDVNNASTAMAYIAAKAGLILRTALLDRKSVDADLILSVFPFEDAVRCHDRISREFSAMGVNYSIGIDYGYVNGLKYGAFVGFDNSGVVGGAVDMKGYGDVLSSIFSSYNAYDLLPADGFPQAFTFTLPGYDFITARAVIRVTKVVAAVAVIAGAAIYFGLKARKKRRAKKAAAEASRMQAEYNKNPTPENFKKLNKANRRNARLNKLAPVKQQDPPVVDLSELYSEIVSVGTTIDVDYAADSD